MSVGAGSIKRAAKAADGKAETKAAKPVEETAVTGTAEVEKSKPAVVKKKAAKSVAKEVSSDKTGAATKNTEKAEVKKPTVTSPTVYGIGQELPIHLM